MPEPPGTLAEALIRLQATLPRITKEDEAQVGTRTYRYANLASIHDAVFPLLADCGLCWTCRPTIGPADVFVLAYSLKHAPSGEELIGTYPLPVTGSPQAIGSAITYARRYTLTAVLGIAPVEDDDDGAAAEQAAKASYEDRVAAGRMSREQMREHGQLQRDTLASRPAERVTGPAPDNADWETAPEDQAGSIEPGQRTKIMRLYARAGVTDRNARLAYAMRKLNLTELDSTNDLSYKQALALIEHLEGEL